MEALTVAACCIAGSALVVGLPRSMGVQRRLQYLRRESGDVVPGPRGDRRGVVALSAAVGTGLAVALAVGSWQGLIGGVAAGIVIGRTLRKQESPAVRQARMQAGAELPFAVDLVAAGLRAGAPTAAAVAAVAAVWGGPLGQRLDRVAGALWLGTPASEAWVHLADVNGAARVVSAAVRSSESGAALADALLRVSDDLRIERAARVEAAARRSGVLVVLPLGLCFLPAFVMAGLVPLIIAVLQQVAL